ncbi:hypothetical protein F5148DRAFT_1152321 [Russula earlei]|uniref:Uncharacterized protein n=1 Tax=Russula earlei TaxID=71964 RepID=A0ACC0TWV6_9AGAM|nr:hypothetical protein F5148DRAFT_1152321 [Russula earlei]
MTTVRMQEVPFRTRKDQLLLEYLGFEFANFPQHIVFQHLLGFSPEAVLTSSLEVSPDDSEKLTGTITLRGMSEVRSLLKYKHPTRTTASRVASRIAIDTHFHGFTVVAGGTNSKLDWTVGDVMWLRDLLPKQVPDARVLLYGYNANLIGDISKSRIEDHARLFIQSLHGLEEIQKRRVIFICHSLGGLVLKQALIFIRNGIEYSALRNVALGVIFLGTPHKGSTQVDMADILVNIARTSFRANAKQLLRTIEEDSARLMGLTHNFRKLHPELKFISFCEQLPMKLPGRFFTKAIDLGVVVDASSATLDGESAIPVDRDHVTIAKYASARDVVYRLVVDRVKKMAASSKIQEKSTPKVTTGYRDIGNMSLGISKSSSRLPSPSNTDIASETIPEVRTSHNPSPRRSPQPEPVHFASRIQFKIVDETGQDFHVIDHAVKGTSDIWEVTSLTTLKLKIRESGTSGSLLLSNGKSSESFSVVAGMHDDNPWCDIVVDVPGNAVSRLITDSYHESRSGRLSANSEKTSSRGTIISLTISDLQSNDERIATVLIRKGGQISTPPAE